jgi:hypothetical protein
VSGALQYVKSACVGGPYTPIEIQANRLDGGIEESTTTFL